MVDYRYQNRYRFDNVFPTPLDLPNFMVSQIGDLYCEPNTEFGDHYQDMFELSFIVEGKGVFYSNGTASPVEKGDIYITLKEDIHRIRADNVNPLHYYYIAFMPKPDTAVYRLISIFKEAVKDPVNRVVKIPTVFNPMSVILSEIGMKYDFHINIIDSELQKILILLYRHIMRLNANNYNIQINSTNGTAFNIANYIDTNFIYIRNLNDLSQKFSYNYAYLSKLFKQVMDKTILEYLMEKKLEYSCILLVSENNSVTKISEMLGYSSPNNFSRAFKNHFGMSPIKYARLHKI